MEGKSSVVSREVYAVGTIKGCDDMNIQSIARSHFDRLPPQNPALDNVMVEQVEWFSNRSGSLLGTVAKGEGVAEWNYAILKRDRKGDFHVRKVMNNIFNLRAARVDLLLSMEGLDKIDFANRGTADFLLPSMPAKLLAVNMTDETVSNPMRSPASKEHQIRRGTGAVVP
jgi:hypothetical protein